MTDQESQPARIRMSHVPMATMLRRLFRIGEQIGCR